MNTPNDLGRARKRRNPRIGFAIHLFVYVVVNVMLLAINLSTSTEHLWFKWPLLGWGVGILAHALAVFFFSPRSRLPG